MKEEALTVNRILDTQAQFDHSLEVRAVAPALVLILEREAPLRMEALSSTRSEFEALREEIATNPRWREILGSWYLAKDDEDDLGICREDEHAERLDAGQKLSTL